MYILHSLQLMFIIIMLYVATPSSGRSKTTNVGKNNYFDFGHFKTIKTKSVLFVWSLVAI